MATVSAQLCLWQVEQPGEGRAPRLPNKAVLCSFPLPSVPATALPALWAQNLRAISGPFVVDLAWENLRSWRLDTTAFLRGVKVIPWAWLLWSGGPAPCFWFPPTPSSQPLATSMREQNTHHWDGLPVDMRQLVATGVVKAQKSIYLKMGPFCSMNSEHMGLCCFLHTGKSDLSSSAGFL